MTAQRDQTPPPARGNQRPASGLGPWNGFPAGRLRFTPVPDLFFSRLLPQIGDLGELKVLLHLIWLLSRQQGPAKFVTFRALAADATLAQGLGAGQTYPDALRRALQAAVERGTVLHATVEIGGTPEDLYFLNTARGRQTLAQLRSGELDLGQVVLEVSPPAQPKPSRPSVFALYEQNIGLLTPLIAEELKEAEERYPAAWIEEAIRQAVEYNRRSWRYVRRILERWEVEGRMDEEDRRHPKGYGWPRRSHR